MFGERASEREGRSAIILPIDTHAHGGRPPAFGLLRFSLALSLSLFSPLSILDVLVLARANAS